jgi:alkylation response protein AidB-like acyl-CoA dehydrogenase
LDWGLTPGEEALRQTVRDWFAERLPRPMPCLDSAEGVAAHRLWEAELFEAGYAVPTWPVEYGGRDATIVEWLIIEDEYHRAGGPARVSQNGIFLLGPTLLRHGTDAQKKRFLPPMASGQEIWAQAWSEPGAGSDLASVRSTARRVDGGWLLSGQKTWSTRAAFADWAFGLFRSGPVAARHRALTFVLFPLTAPGVTVRAVPRIDGMPGFAEIFLDDVFVPDDQIVGEPGDGWTIAMSTAGEERGLTLRSPGRFASTADRLLDAALRSGSLDEAHWHEVVDAWLAAEAYRARTLADVGRAMRGATLGARSSYHKLFWSELDVRLHELALDLLGPGAELVGSDDSEVNQWLDGFLFALSGTIYAGTNEIQRNIIAERVLGLPR